MPRYQIRIPEGMEIEDFINELSAKAWQMLSTAPENVTLPAQKDDIYREFRAKVMDTFVPVVKSFRLCGLSNICSEKIESTELSLESHVLEASPTDKIYQFFIKDSLKEFLDTLSHDSLGPLEPYTAKSIKSAQELVRLAFHEVLGEYLYDCPTCGKTELCICSQSAPEPVWKDQHD